jgi:hypothetical protein
MSIRYFFNIWRSRVEMFKRYDKWCETHEETIPMDSDDWCYNIDCEWCNNRY